VSDFSSALLDLKIGNKVARKEWSNDAVYIFLRKKEDPQ
jgi:hypothetical protein